MGGAVVMNKKEDNNNRVLPTRRDLWGLRVGWFAQGAKAAKSGLLIIRTV